MSNLPMKIMCINDKNKPAEIPQTNWITQGTIYTLISVQHLLSSGVLGFELDEVKLDESCFPYHYFNPNRFVPIDETELQNAMDELEDILKPITA